jgi:hypothetical protein
MCVRKRQPRRKNRRQARPEDLVAPSANGAIIFVIVREYSRSSEAPGARVPTERRVISADLLA